MNQWPEPVEDAAVCTYIYIYREREIKRDRESDILIDGEVCSEPTSRTILDDDCK